MNILVINPEYAANKEIVYMPLGLAILSAVAEQSGHIVKVLDMHNLRLPDSELENELLNNKYSVVLIGGFAMQVKNIAKLTKIIRVAQPECQIVIGGVGVSDIPEIALNYTGVDAVAIGESELTLPNLLKSIEIGKPYEGVLGYVYRGKNGNIVKNPRGPAPENLDELPMPAYHLFDIDFISRHSYNGRGMRSIHLMTSRGCPFQCNFCINSVLNNNKILAQIHGKIVSPAPKSQRTRSPQSIINEIEFLKTTYGITDFHFADEEFVTNKKRLEEICSALEPAGVTWSTSGRADWTTEDKLLRMKKAGCQYILFGVESGSQTMLNHMKKNAKINNVSSGLKTAKRVGMNFIANFMVGHPGETEITIRETVEFCKEHGLVFLPAYVTLFPNSKMFHDFKETISDWDEYFDGLSKVDFSRQLFMNLTEMPSWKLVYLRNWAIAETSAHAMIPNFPRFFQVILVKFLQVAVFASDNAPNKVRHVLRDILRSLFDFNSKRRLPDSGSSAESQQIPPNDVGQDIKSFTDDAYEESLRELRSK